MASHKTSRVALAGLIIPLVGIAGFHDGATSDLAWEDIAARSIEFDLPYGDRTFHGVVDLVPQPEGTWVLSMDDRALTFLAADGSFRSYARRGGGPGEVRLPVALTLAPTGDPVASHAGVELWDFGARRVTRFDGGGAVDHTTDLDLSFSTSIRSDLPDVTFAKPFKVRRQGAAVVAANFNGPVTQPYHLRRATLIRSGEDLASDGAGPGIPVMADPEMRTPPMGHAPVPLWDVCDESTMVLLDPDTRSLSWVSDGAAHSTAPLPFPERDLTEDERLNYVFEMVRLEAGDEALMDPMMIAEMEKMAAPGSGMFPKTAPPASGLVCLSDRSALIREFDASSHPMGHSELWTWIGPDGTILDRLSIPNTFEPLTARSTELWGVHTSPITELQTIAAIRLTPRDQILALH